MPRFKRIIHNCLGFALLCSCGERSESELDLRNDARGGGEHRLEEYVGAETCSECHRGAHEEWTGSHHYHAMELPTEETVRADFNGSEFTNYGVTSKFFRKGDEYLVETENQEGKMETFKVAYTFGWEPLQQYLVKFPDGRMQVLPTCWDVERKQWYHLYPDERIAPDDPLFWTRSMQNWDHMCADCHSTNLIKKFDPHTQSFSTSYSEINVSCESCHGPGRRHVELAKSGVGFHEMPHFGLVDLNGSNLAQIEACAKCHARRGFVHPGHHAGNAFLDHFLPEVVQPWSADMQVPTYHVDGQIDDEVYVYGSYLQSKMFHKGVKCTDCHNPHTTRLHSYDNQLCTRCHLPNRNNPAGYDNPTHHFHPMNTEGAKCVECHMPHKTYMGIDERRDHSIRIPRPDLSVEFGSPNACNQCHQDKDAKWAAEAVNRFKGSERPKEVRHPEAFHAFRSGKPNAEQLLIETSQDPHAPAFTRAGALLALRRFISDASNREARRNLDSNESVVRVAAISKMEEMPLSETHGDLVELLSDSVRAVRTEAARVLSRAPRNLFSTEQLELFDEVFAELKLRYSSNLDRPESNLSLGILAENTGLSKEAERHYREAIRREDTYLPARMNLATLLNRMGKNEEAEQLLRDCIELQPTWGQVHYSLGLLLAEDRNRLPEAIRSLERATAYWHDNPRVFNNLAIAYWQVGKFEDARQSFLQAIRLQPDNPEFLRYLVDLLTQRERWNEALPHARKLVEMMPSSPQASSILSIIESRVD